MNSCVAADLPCTSEMTVHSVPSTVPEAATALLRKPCRVEFSAYGNAVASPALF